MPTAADLKSYMSVNAPDNDTDTAGGVIQDTAHATGGRIPTMTPLAANDTLEVVSDAADTRNVTVEGRGADGAILTDTVALNGTTPVAITGTFERVLRCTIDAKDAANTVTLRRAGAGATVMTLGPDVVEGLRAFRKGSSSGSQEVRYEYLYLKNEHGTEALTSAQAQLSADPAANLTMAVATAKGDMGTETNRQTAPTGFNTFVDDGVDQAVPGDQLAAGERVVVALKQTLAIDAAAQKNTWEVQLTGNSV